MAGGASALLAAGSHEQMCVPGPEGPSTQYLRCRVPNNIKSLALGTGDLKYWVLGPSALCMRTAPSVCSLGFSRILPTLRVEAQ